MLPKWFDKWNKENPTNIYGPATLVGVAGAAVFAAAVLVSYGQPSATESLQTGPRGNGMSVTEFKTDLATPDPDIANLVADDPPIRYRMANNPRQLRADKPLARQLRLRQASTKRVLLRFDL